jgi:carbamoylphosphate synthase small subunit
MVPDHREPASAAISSPMIRIKETILAIFRNRRGYHRGPAKTSAADALALKPDGVFLSNGPATLKAALCG